ncbi:unnamed protein product [Nippostrongylus brasiliensis]|uniref:Ammonium_transp domain-containing protein n=1 Tax=Nippostrongylus brasiliensis TaxID=27835 RepID=A0A0N4Y067_NIPBR|nr:unnamed protein product [Nippostrongylus brasiliensis]
MRHDRPGEVKLTQAVLLSFEFLVPEPSPTLSSSLSSIGADIPFLSPGSTGPKPTDNLIRAHTKVLIAMCYQLTQIETTATYFLIGAIGGGLLMMQCCGFFSVSDFYTSWQLDYPSDLEKDGNSTEVLLTHHSYEVNEDGRSVG